ncbi:MAG: DUF5060 domain-containing protein [Verrucomicrobia bacterium]|nr:DUF5060 domain-containing protein [Verrucomicrobiota bacterium]
MHIRCLSGFLVASILCAAPGGAASGTETAARPLVTPYARREPLALRQVVAPAATVRQFERLELTVDASATFDNPFDPADVALDAEVRCPSGRRYVMPGFFHQHFQRARRDGNEVLTPEGKPGWRIRLAFAERGEHHVGVTLRDRSGTATAPPYRVAVTASDHPGFVRISPRDRRYFEFDSGRPMFPIGANTCWGGGKGTYDYDAWFPRFGEAGCNFGRLWLSPHWTTFALDRPGKVEEGRGLGQWDLANAWRIDYVLALAERHGIWLKLCIESFNILREKAQYSQWENTPHNARHGGPLGRPGEFFTNGEMDRLFRAKLRYLVARYAAHTHLFAWEFWNEVDIISEYRTGPVRDWHQRMARALRSMDPCAHLITTSFAHTPGDPEIDRLPEMDYVQSHHYGSADLVQTIARTQAAKAAYDKPHYFGEIGADAGGPRGKDDPEGLQVHDPLWVSVVTGGSGAAQSWWWDNLIHPLNLYPLFTPLQRVTRGIDWPAEHFQPVTPTVAWATPPAAVPHRNLPSNPPPPVVAWALVGRNHALAWARPAGRTWRNVCDRKMAVAPVGATVLRVPGLAPGNWNAEVWDTWGGGMVAQLRVKVEASGEAIVGLPAMARDYAVRLGLGR